MHEYESSVRADVQIGAVCGLGTAAAAWILATSPTLLDPQSLVFAGCGALTGTVSPRLPGKRRFHVWPAVALAALLLFGLGPMVLVALTAGAFRALAAGTGDDPLAVLRGLHGIFAGTLRTALSGLVYLVLGGPVPASPLSAAWLPLGGYVLLAVAATRVLHSLGAPLRPADDPDADESDRLVHWLRGFVAEAGTVVLAIVIAQLYVGAGTRSLLLLGPLGAVAWQLVLSRRRARRRQVVPKPPEVYRSIAHALARAVMARDERVGRRLFRVQRLAVALGRRLELDPLELEALAAAALLSDIGKLGLADRIVVDPDTGHDEEIERIRIHPAMGAEILDAISFPFPVQPIVRHHHERWDGNGYPDGLTGEHIPVGARVLAVAHAYHALTASRPYRRALSRQLALDNLRREAGRAYDPFVVDALVAHLESSGSAWRVGGGGERRSEPQVGDVADPRPLRQAQHELHVLYDIERAMSYRLELEENLTLIAEKLVTLIPFESMAVYLLEDDGRSLRACFARGHGAASLGRLRVDAASCASGRAALDRRDVSMDRRACARDGVGWDFADDDLALSVLQTLAAAPLVARGRCLGSVSLYDVALRRFGDDERRTLAVVAGYLAEAVRRANPTDPAFLESLTDPRTGLPNARYLEISAADLTPGVGECGRGFGLLAFRLTGLERIFQRWGLIAVERLLGVVARRIASGCRESEIPVRFGNDLFLVLCPADDAQALLARWDLLLRAAQSEPVELGRGRTWNPRFASAHAACPHNGGDLTAVLETLAQRLGPTVERGSRVLPFRATRAETETVSAAGGGS